MARAGSYIAHMLADQFARLLYKLKVSYELDDKSLG